MTKLLDLRTYLPGQAKTLLREFLFSRLEASRLNSYTNPKYDFTDARRDTEDQSEWVRSQLDEQFELALKEYDRKHPKGWSNEGQYSYRVGIPDELHMPR